VPETRPPSHRKQQPRFRKLSAGQPGSPPLNDGDEPTSSALWTGSPRSLAEGRSHRSSPTPHRIKSAGSGIGNRYSVSPRLPKGAGLSSDALTWSRARPTSLRLAPAGLHQGECGRARLSSLYDEERTAPLEGVNPRCTAQEPRVRSQERHRLRSRLRGAEATVLLLRLEGRKEGA